MRIELIVTTAKAYLRDWLNRDDDDDGSSTNELR